MIDKELNELANEIPEYNIDEYKNGIYEKFNNKPIKTIHYSKYIIISIILLLLLTSFISINAYNIHVEAEEYQTAVDFFEEYDLPLEGLSRTEIKEIYKDITTNKFNYDKTGEVIVECIKTKVPGYNIEIEDMDQSEIKNTWYYWNELLKQQNEPDKPTNTLPETNLPTNSLPEINIYYKYESFFTEFENNTIDLTKYIFKKYEDDSVLWSLDLSYRIDGYEVYEDYLFIYGRQLSYYSTEYAKIAYLTKVDNDGNIIWQQEFADSSKIFNIIVEENNINVFVNRTYQNNYIQMYSLDNDGNVLFNSEKNNCKDNIEKISKISDFYLIYLKDEELNPKFLIMNDVGVIEKELSISDDNYKYIFTDILEYNGNIYLSSYSIPIDTDSTIHNEVGSIDKVLQDIPNNEITNSYVLSLIKANYKAVLFICDKNSGELNTFYSIDDCLGSDIKIKNGNIIWEVEYFQSMLYTPYISSYIFSGVTQVYNYTFDTSNQLISSTKTEELREFYR